MKKTTNQISSKLFQSKKIILTLISAFALFSSPVLGQSTFNVANGNWNSASNWTPSGVPAGNTAIIIPAGDICNMVSGDSYTGSGAITLSGGFTVASGATFKPTGVVTMNTNNANLSGGGSISLSTLTISTTNSTDVVSITNSTGAGVVAIKNGGTLNFTEGILKLGSANTLAFAGGATINAIAPSNFANASDGTGLDADSDGGTISLAGSSGNTLAVNNGVTFYNVNSGTDGNVQLNLNTATTIINGTLTIVNQQGKFGVTNSPVWGPLSTLYVDYKNGFDYNPGKEWVAQTGASTATTPGYPANVTLTNIGTSAGGAGNGNGWVAANTGDWSIRGTFTLGDGVNNNAQVDFSQLPDFTCENFVLNTGSRFTAPTSMTVNGNWTDNQIFAGSTHNPTAGFVNNSGTVLFGGAGTCTAPNTLTAPAGNSETFNNLSIINGANVNLNSPVIVTNTFTLTSGILFTTPANILNITNTSTNAVTGAGIGAGSSINGPLNWSLGSAAGTYLFPFSSSSCSVTYLPLTLNKAASAAATVTAEAFAQGSNGTVDATMSSLSTTEYWSLSTTSSLTGSTVSISRPTPIAPLAYIGESITTSNGVYTSLGGTAVANGVNNSNDIGSGTTLFFTLGVPPIVSTLAATSITTTGATLNGAFNTQGSSLLTSFSYGTTTSSGLGTPVSIHSPINSTSATLDSAVITGLTANTLYTYVATDGANSGSNVTFITAPNPPTVGTPSNPTIDGLTANWAAPSVPGTATYTYTVQISTDSTFATGVTTQSGIASGTTSFVFTTLSSATTYYYRVEAVNATANSTWSSTSTGIATDIFPTPACTTGTGSTTSTGAITKALTLPTIDGQVDPVWAGVPANNISNVSVGNSTGNTQTWKAMWTNDSLYFLIQVTDPTLISQDLGLFGSASLPGITPSTSGLYYGSDGVELTLDPDYSHGGGYDNVNDVQFRFNLGSTSVSGESNGGTAQFQGTLFQRVSPLIDFKVIPTFAGYNVEAAIPWGSSGVAPGIDTLPLTTSLVRTAAGYGIIANGKNIGLEVQVNDATGPGSRATQYSWFNTSQNPYSNPSTFAEATLTACPIPPTVILPTVTNITDTSAILGATVTSSGDAALTANGTGYTANPLATGTENALAASTIVTPPSAFTTPRTSLAPQTKYYFLGYANNANSETGVSNVDSFYTLSALPTEKTVITPNSCSQVTLNWTAINFPSADSATQTGYILLRSISPAVPSTTGITTRVATTQSALASGTTLVTTINSGATLTYIDATAVAGTTYNYLLVPFTSDGVPADSTYNYFITGADSISTGLGTGLSAPTVNVTQPTCAVATSTIAVSNPLTDVTYSFDGGATYVSNSSIDTTAGTYKVQVKTTAGCVSADTSVTVNVQPATPIVKVQPDSTIISEGSTITFTSSSTVGGTYLWTVSPTTNLSSTSQPQTTSTPTQAGTYVYKLTVTTDANCIGSDSIPVTVNQSLICPLNPPKVFTPNNDGHNDTWKIFAGCSTNNEVSVYNRWGSLVYHSDVYDNSNAWNGTYKGDAIPDGTYYYVILSTQGGRTYTLTGNVTILR